MFISNKFTQFAENKEAEIYKRDIKSWNGGQPFLTNEHTWVVNMMEYLKQYYNINYIIPAQKYNGYGARGPGIKLQVLLQKDIRIQ